MAAKGCAENIVLNIQKVRDTKFSRNPGYRHNVVRQGDGMNQPYIVLSKHPAEAMLEPGSKDSIKHSETTVEARSLNPSKSRPKFKMNFLLNRRRWRGEVSRVDAQHLGMVRSKKCAE